MPKLVHLIVSGMNVMPNVDLTTLKYYEHLSRPLEWSVEGLVFGQINLLVGRNATGKSRVLRLINNLSKLLLKDQLGVSESNYDATFTTDGKELRYVLRAEQGTVLEEKVYIDGVIKLDRNGQTLDLFYEKQEEGLFIKHEPAENEVSAAARKDKLQHSFLILLHEWAQSVRYYTFGEKLGQNSLGVKVDDKPKTIDDTDQDRVVQIFLSGRDRFKADYVNAVLDDMKALGYPLSEITAASPENMKIELLVGEQGTMKFPGQLIAIGVREEGIGGIVFQRAISQGMFRALSILVQVNYSQMSKRAHCIIIDDIGEGLDFERSAKLIEILRQKANSSEFQLIMATNDRFVMNHVPLEEWSVLQRQGNHLTVRNIHNAQKEFEEFKFVGMSNSAFFEMDFVDGGLEDPATEGASANE